MSSTVATKLHYLKTKVSNAWWMLKNGKLNLFWENFWLEFHHQKNRPLDRVGAPENFKQGPPSKYVDKRKVIPASYRPTSARTCPQGTLQADPQSVANELQNILSTFTDQEKRAS
jgi:hypothetical protein